jgi:hypothetical protein
LQLAYAANAVSLQGKNIVLFFNGAFCQIVSVTLINCLGHPEFSIEFLRAMGTLRRQM